MSHSFLSSGVGVPLALFTMTLLFLLDMTRVSGRPRPFGMRSVTVVAVVALLAFIAARFMAYS
jgi:hypothetical protein